MAGETFTGTLDTEFALFDDELAGGQVGPTLAAPGLAVQEGLFEVALDFGVVFDTPLWLEIRIRPAGSPSFETLHPRQPLTGVPGAVYSLDADDADTVDGRDASDLEIQSITLDGTVLRITEGGTTVSQNLASLTADDADMDPANELNTAIVLNGTDLEITDAGGTLTADLSSIPDGVDDADNDPANELITGVALAGTILELIEGGQITNMVDLSALLNQALELDGTTLRITDGGGTLSVDLAPIQDGVDDADADPSNELNTAIVLNGTDLELTDAGGTLVADLSTFPVDDADADPTNELIDRLNLTNANDTLDIVEAGITNQVDVTPLQNSALGFDGTSLSITDGGGTLQVDISALEDDADANPANELNTGLSFSGTEIDITDAGGTLTADLSAFPVEDADADPTNELIDRVNLTNSNDALDIVEAGITNQVDVTPLQNSALSFDGTSVSLTDGGGTLQVDISALEDDADADPANELNTGLSFSGTEIDITDAGGTLTADLSAFPVDDADPDPTNELIDRANLTNGNDALDIVEAGLTNQVDVTPLQNSALTFDGTQVSLTDGGGTLQADLSALEDDADADPSNELNTGLVLSGTDLEITDAGGTITADLSGFPVDDADADPTNELIDRANLTNGNEALDIVEAGITNQVDVTPLQNSSLTFDGTQVSITDGGGTVSADISALGDDADPDPLNELNTTLVLSGAALELSDAGGTLVVDLSPIQDGTADADADPTNELISDLYLTNGGGSPSGQLGIVEAGITNSTDVTPLQNSSLGFDGTQVALTDGGGTVQVDISALENDADFDPANELNTTLVLNGNELELSDAGGTLTVDLSTIADGVTDADADPSNELISDVYLTNDSTLEIVEAGLTNSLDVTPLQNTSLQLSGTDLQLTDGGGTVTADLSTYLDVHTALALTNTMLALTDPDGTLQVDLSPIDGINDLDTDPGNELITSLVLSGTMLEITEGGNLITADLSALTNSVSQPSPLFSGFGWRGSTASTGIGPAGGMVNSKILEIVETATSNRFEVDFNRMQPGTIIDSLPFTITNRGLYYLTDNLFTAGGASDGITIDASDVTIDLMGFSVLGTAFTNLTSGTGIVVANSQTNIKVRNGGVAGWQGDGINALGADYSIWRDLYVGQNFGHGLIADENNLVYRVTAFSNGLDGINGGLASVVMLSSTGQNGFNGFTTGKGSTIFAAAAFDNGADGFDVGPGSSVAASTATDNIVMGFDIGDGSVVARSQAYDNVSNGFDLASGGLIRDSIASLNSGSGIQASDNNLIIDNKLHENDNNGIQIYSTNNHLEGNQTTDNDRTGIEVLARGNLIIRNTCSGNVTNFNLVTNSAFGPIFDVTSVGSLANVPGAEHPWANFVY